MAQSTYEFPSVWTEADYARLPDDGHRYEIIDGALHMTPPPVGTHQFRGIESYWRVTRSDELYVHTAPVGTEYTNIEMFGPSDIVDLALPYPVTFRPGALAD